MQKKRTGSVGEQSLECAKMYPSPEDKNLAIIFDQPGAAFTLLPAGIKFPPSYCGWQLPENARTFQQAQEHACKGGNVGILAGNGYIGLDQDDPTAFNDLELPTTTRWETRTGRYGLLFKCSDVAEALAGIDKKADQAQLKLFKDGKPCGEVKLERTYQVIPPSWKKLEDGSRADYKLIDSSPPADIRLSDLLEGLQAIGLTFTSKLEANTAKLEQRAREARQKAAVSDDTRARHYAEAALRDEVLTLAGAPDGERNNQLNLSAFAMAQFIAAGALTEIEVISELTRAAENTGLDSEEIRKTILSGLEAGKLHPRKIPEPEEKPAPTPGPVLRREDICNIDYNDKGEEKSCKLSPTRAAGAIMETMSLVMSKDDDAIYYFKNGIYDPDGVRVIDLAMCNAAGDAVDARKLKEVLRRIQNALLCDPVAFDPNPYLLGVKNGVVDLRTGEFREYRPEDLITDQIEVKYDPTARCPRFLKFLEEVEPVVIDRLMLVDWFAIHAIRYMFPYVMFLLGLGRNGKGIYERVLKQFFREESFSEMQLEELNVKNNRFAGAALKGKRGQIVSEAGEERKPGSKRTIPTNYLKFVTGDGTIDSDQKCTVRTRFKPFYKATVDTNDMPLITDLSRGWIERFCKVNMPYVFVDNPAPGTLERKKDPKLFEKLTTADEMSGILNLILARTPEIIKTGAITKRLGADMFAEYQQQSSSIKTFLDMFCDYTATSDRSKDLFLDLIFEKYEEWCDLIVADKVDEIRFGKAVKTFCNGAEPERIRDGKKKRRIYHGLSFDLKRYQSHWDHYHTIKGPLKTVTAPLRPLNDEYKVLWKNLVEKYGKKMDETKNLPFFEPMGMISIPENANGADIGFNGPENQFNGPGLSQSQQAGIGPHPRSEEQPTKMVRIILADGYMTQIQESPGKWCDVLYSFNEVVELPEWRAKDLIDRGIAKAVVAGA